MPSPTPLRSKATGAAGFTLLELLVVLAILALLTGIAAVAARGRGGVDLRTAALELAADLRTLRDEAVRRQIVTSLSPDQIARHVLQRADGRRLPLSAGITITFEPGVAPLLGDASDRLLFFADGSSSGGAIRLTRGASAIRLRIDWIDGNVAIDG